MQDCLGKLYLLGVCRLPLPPVIQHIIEHTTFDPISIDVARLSLIGIPRVHPPEGDLSTEYSKLKFWVHGKMGTSVSWWAAAEEGVSHLV